MSSILELKKRSLKLRSRLKKSLQKNATNEFINKLQCEKITIPFAVDRWCYLIPQFLTDKDSKCFINFLHKNGDKNEDKTEEKKTSSPKQEKRKIKKLKTRVINNPSKKMKPRGLTWTINKNEVIADLIYQRLYPFLPKIWMDKTDDTIWEISGINDDIKSLKYGKGDVLCPHFDTPYFKNKKEKSFITIVLYLNDDFIGGSFKFINPRNQNRTYPIKIKKGNCLLFQHDTFHQGSSIQKGTKYMIRFDILYRKIIPKQPEKTNNKLCVWL